jgi:hypothetical protein
VHSLVLSFQKQVMNPAAIVPLRIDEFCKETRNNIQSVTIFLKLLK